jgi:hypothetical protein
LLAFEGIWNFFLHTRVRFVDGYFPAAWGAAMNRNDQYLSHAADCQLMACMTRDESERQTWLDVAADMATASGVTSPHLIIPVRQEHVIIAGGQESFR